MRGANFFRIFLRGPKFSLSYFLKIQICMQKYLKGANLEKLVLTRKKADKEKLILLQLRVATRSYQLRQFNVTDLVRTSNTEDARMGSVNNGREWRAQVSTVKLEGKSITISYTTISIYIWGVIDIHLT